MYVLEKEDLLTILKINNINSYSHYGENPVDSFSLALNSRVLDEIVKLQPELIELQNNLIEQMNTCEKKTGHYFCLLFSELFDKRVNITSLSHCLFSNSYKVISGDDSFRKKLFLKLNDKSENFFPIIYEEINNKTLNVDSSLYDCYLQILRNNKKLLSKSNNKDILKSIQKIDTFFSPNLSKKKIYTYVHLFEQNQFLYDFVMKDMGELFNQSASLNNYWQSKLGGFDKKTIFKDEEKISKFKEEKSFFYSFELSPEWIIKDQKISEKQARLFCISFKRVLNDILNDSFDVDFVNKNMNDLSSISITTKTENESVIIKKFFNEIVEYIPMLFKNFNHDSDISYKVEKIQEYILNLNKYKVSKNLEDQLEIKPSRSNKLKL